MLILINNEFKNKITKLSLFYNSKYDSDRHLAAAIVRRIKNDRVQYDNEETYKEIDLNLDVIWLSSEKQNTRWSAYLLNMRDYIEIYIDDNKMSISKYNDKLSYYTKKYKNIRIIPNKTDIGDIDCESLGNYDLTTIIKSLIPKDLKDKFKIIEDRAEY